MIRKFIRRAGRLLGAALLLVAGAAQANDVLNEGRFTLTIHPTPPSAATFNHTGALQTWTVPVTAVYRLSAQGAQGAAGNGTSVDSRNGAGGLGGRAEGERLLTEGTVINVYVGGAGAGRTGGWNGGGAGTVNSSMSGISSGGGGGATDFRIGGTGLNNRVLVAGGGGGGAGSQTGTSSGVGGGGGGGYFGGGGGGGKMGSDATTCFNGTTDGADGRFGVGGNGGATACTTSIYGNAPGAGGAGGGLGGTGSGGQAGGADLGGNGGARVRLMSGSTPATAAGGGGGGSSFVGGVTNPLLTSGVRSGHGAASISFVRYPNAQEQAPSAAPSRWVLEYTGIGQTWTAPVSGYYRLTAFGASGAPGWGEVNDSQNAGGGRGGRTTGEVYLSAGTVLSVNVGGGGPERAAAGTGGRPAM